MLHGREPEEPSPLASEAFDPVKWRELHSHEEMPDSVGIRMVLGLVKDVRYFNAFRSNNLILYLDGKTADS